MDAQIPLLSDFDARLESLMRGIELMTLESDEELEEVKLLLSQSFPDKLNIASSVPMEVMMKIHLWTAVSLIQVIPSL